MVMDGFINVDKPQGMTSHDVVAIIRKQLPRKTKVGHTGTLDPDATGVLPICVGKATRLAEYITGLPKTYRGELTLGVITDSWDATGEVLANCDASHISLANLENVLPEFIGEIEQIPPMLSAIKVNGQKLYQLARKGEEIVREPRKITIYDLKIIKSEFGINTPKIVFDINCSRGTYIRSLFYDIGNALGVGGHMSALRRLAVGPFNIENSYTLEDVKTKLAAFQTELFLPMKIGVEHLPVFIIKNAENYDDVLHGRTFKVDIPDMPVCCIETAEGVLAGIASIKNGHVSINKMLLSV